MNQNSPATMICPLIKLLQEDVEAISKGKSILTLPRYSVDQIKCLCETLKRIFQSEPSVLSLKPNIVVVGDLHGHFLDLLRILIQFDMPPKTRYLFLGDIVDRGEFSLETLLFILLMKAAFPKSVSIIRGNHEFREVYEAGGFLGEILEVYHEPSVANYIEQAFQYMPVAAIINDTVLCVHGGIGPDIQSLQQIKDIQKPIKNFDGSIVDTICWSDPSDTIQTSEPSPRGTGYLFGQQLFEEFMKKNDLEYLIRAHEQIETGIQYHFNGKLLTVFSASSYCGSHNNQAGVLRITDGMKLVPTMFEPLNYLRRYSVMFTTDLKQPTCPILPPPQIQRPNSGRRKNNISSPLPKISSYSASMVGNSLLLNCGEANNSENDLDNLPPVAAPRQKPGSRRNAPRRNSTVCLNLSASLSKIDALLVKPNPNMTKKPQIRT